MGIVSVSSSLTVTLLTGEPYYTFRYFLFLLLCEGNIIDSDASHSRSSSARLSAPHRLIACYSLLSDPMAESISHSFTRKYGG